MIIKGNITATYVGVAPSASLPEELAAELNTKIIALTQLSTHLKHAVVSVTPSASTIGINAFAGFAVMIELENFIYDDCLIELKNITFDIIGKSLINPALINISTSQDQTLTIT